MNREQMVVFVCEHGSAKSVVAAAHFNRLAAERWDGVPPVSEDYAEARDEIVERLRRLLDDLEADK